ncbi:MAG: hypothetical protein HOO06_03615 [Bdellovibrionaceae bacterium]|nr:hypothetical protein [Pseudobdellovibrionaceae bacterium]
MKPPGNSENKIHLVFKLNKFIYTLNEEIMLTVAIQNQSENTIEFMNFKDDACFAHFYLKSKISKSISSQLNQIESPQPHCNTLSWPGSAQKIKPNEVIEKKLALATFIHESLEVGLYNVRFSWNEKMLGNLFEKKYNLNYNGSFSNKPEMYIVKNKKIIELELNKLVKLDSGFELALTGHTHKRTRVGQKSPLVTSFRFKKNNQNTEGEARVNVFPPEQFSIEGHGFEPISHKYNESMKLIYLGVLPK